MRVRSWVGGLCGLVLLALAGCGEAPAAGSADTQGAATEAPSGTTGASTQPEVARVGEAVRVGDWQYVLLKEGRGEVVADSTGFEKQEAKGYYVVLVVEVTNKGQSAQVYSPELMSLVDREGNTYAPDDMATFIESDALNLPEPSTMNPGIAAQVAVVFDVPETLGARDFRLRVADGAFLPLHEKDIQLEEFPSK